MESANPEVLTVEEAARYLRASKQSVRVWLREGVLPGLRIGTYWRIRRADLKALFERRERARTHPAALESESEGPSPEAVLAIRKANPDAEARRQEALRAAFGSLRDVPGSGEDFLLRKREEKAREEERERRRAEAR